MATEPSKLQRPFSKKDSQASVGMSFLLKDTETTIFSKEDTTALVINPASERALVWKFDIRILPVLAIMYLFHSLDKSNLGNAKTASLEKTLGLRGNQYNIILSVFFVPYVLTAPFLALLGKKYGPNRELPLMMFCSGCFTLLATAAENFSGLLALRWVLGKSKRCFFPSGDLSSDT